MFDRFSSLFSWFLSAWGLFALSFLDASIFFFAPLATDLVVILLVARNPDSFWIYPALAVAGTVAGTALTFRIGRKIGEVGLARFVSARKLDRAKRHLKKKGAFAAGALEVKFNRFIATAALMKTLRFGVETLLARRYGQSIIAWTETSWFQGVVVSFIVVAVAGTAFAIYRAVRSPAGSPAE